MTVVKTVHPVLNNVTTYNYYIGAVNERDEVKILENAGNTSGRSAKLNIEDNMVPYGLLLLKNLTEASLTAHEYALLSKVH